MTIDDERAAFIRDLLRVLTSLYSWAGAVVHGQTEDGHDVIELCDGTRVWTERRGVIVQWRAPGYRVFPPLSDDDGDAGNMSLIGDVERYACTPCHAKRIRDLLSGPPEDA